VQGARDTSGNSQTPETLPDAFDVDTIDPTVTSVTPSATTLNLGSVGSTFTLAVAFSQLMDTTVAPVIGFSPGVGALLSALAGSWTNSSTYTASYNVANAGLTTPAVSVTVQGAKDADGNSQVGTATLSGFAVDQQAPTITALAVSSG